MFIVVDLPQPEGPSNATKVPSSITRSRSSTAVKRPKVLVTFWIWISATGVSA